MIQFPFIFHENWATGLAPAFNAPGSNPALALGVAHFSQIAERSDLPLPPGDSAFALLMDFARSSAPAYLTGPAAIALSSTRYLSMPLILSPDTSATHLEEVRVAQLRSSLASELEVVLRFDSNVGGGSWTIGITDGNGSLPLSAAAPFPVGQVVHVEVRASIDSANASAQLYLNDTAVGTPVTNMSNNAVTHLRVGDINGAPFEQGYLLFGEVILSQSQMFPAKTYENDRVVDRSRHIFVGPGRVEVAGLMRTSSQSQAVFYDTDRAELWRAKPRLWLTETNTDVERSVQFQKGCFVELIGSDTRAIVNTRGVRKKTDECVIAYGREVAADDPYDLAA